MATLSVIMKLIRYGLPMLMALFGVQATYQWLLFQEIGGRSQVAAGEE